MAMTWKTFRDTVLDRIHDASLATQVIEWYNSVQEEVELQTKWRHLDQELIFPTVVNYKTGTVAVTNGSAIVTGTGTTFPASLKGELFAVSGTSQPYYKVASVESATQITLGSNFIGTTGSGKTYKVVYYQYGPPADLAIQRIQQVTLQVGSGPYQKLWYLTEDALFDYTANEILVQSRPYRFRFFGGNFQLWPPPDVVYNVHVYYTRSPVQVSASTVDGAALDWPEPVIRAMLDLVVAEGFLYADDDNADRFMAKGHERLKRAISENNRIPTSRLTIRRWDDGVGGFPRAPIYPQNLG